MNENPVRWVVGPTPHHPHLVRLTTYGPEMDLTAAEAREIARGLYTAAKQTETRQTRKGTR